MDFLFFFIFLYFCVVETLIFLHYLCIATTVWLRFGKDPSYDKVQVQLGLTPTCGYG